MKKISFFYRTHKNKCYITAGLLLSCLLMIPYILLGTGSIIPYHDQLDGELFSYILTARYLFTNIHIYPEIMNGLPAAGAVPPAPLFVLLYVICKPFTAFLLSQWCIYIVGFLGMFLLLKKLTEQEFISFGIAVIFILLPFYPVYGLCIPGQPMLFYTVLELRDIERNSAQVMRAPRKTNFLYYLLIIFYGASSSLVLVGYACLFLLSIFALRQSVKKSYQIVSVTPWISFGLLLFTYILTNLGLLKQVLFPKTAYISHKTELVLSAQNIPDSFLETLTQGVPYAQSFHTVLFLLIIVSLFVFLFCLFIRKELLKQENIKKPLTVSAHTGLLILGVCLFYALYHSSSVTELRNASDGVLKTFNLDRFCWLLPTLWCILAGELLCFITKVFQSPALIQNAPSVPQRFRNILAKCFLFIILGIWGCSVLLHSSLRPNLSKLLKGGDYYALDWDSFYAEDIFSQINTAIGKPQDSYHVISIGIYPAAAAYNGFYCLDGYSNNYPLDYKHTFRQIMEKELEKNHYIKAYFDNWGNRCYITTAEQNNYYTFEKKWNTVLYNLELNTDKLKELDCQYIFSAAYIMNAEEMGLSLLQDAPFETNESWYHIYVYSFSKPPQ